MAKGYLSLVLHAHLPFVRHPEHEISLEEDWLFEAITETYIPLLNMLEGMAADGVKFRLAISISPTLIEMLEDQFLKNRYIAHLDRLIELADKEVSRLRSLPQFQELARMYHDRFISSRESFLSRGSLTQAFKSLHDAGYVEILTCAATHAFLPLLSINEQAVRAQIRVARAHYEETFGKGPDGFWAPECGYEPGLEKYLKEEGLKYFFADAHGLLCASPRPKYGVFAPVVTQNSVAVFGRDIESSREVWSSKVGYPGDPCYRDFYRDIGFDLDLDYLRPYIQPTGHRKMTGIKYYRITGGSGDKDVYQPSAAIARAKEHAENFISRRIEQIKRAGELIDRPPLIVAPYDAELFGHWWHEGPEFLNFLFRTIDSDQNDIELITPNEYLALYPENQVVNPARSSWGLRGHSEMWLDENNDWIYRHLHKAADRMVQLAQSYPDSDGVLERALNQSARELLLAQSSDWAFIMKSGSMTQYAVKRTKDHLLRFKRLYEDITSGHIDEDFLKDLEEKDNIFPKIDYRVYEK